LSSSDVLSKMKACKGLILDEKTILVAEELPDLANALAKAGQEVLTTPFNAVYLWGGAWRGWHHPWCVTAAWNKTRDKGVKENFIPDSSQRS